MPAKLPAPRSRAVEPYQQTKVTYFSERTLMTYKLLVSAVLPACIALQIAAPPIPASGQELFGAVGGMTRDCASRQPLAQVRITAHNLNRGTDRTATSGSDGTF